MTEHRYDPQIQLTGSGPPLVLVSGMDGTGRLFYRQVPHLASRFCVATYALRDHATRMETLVSDLADVIGAVARDGEPAVIVGESFGGALAMSFALAHQTCVCALVLLNTFPAWLQHVRLRLAIGGLGLMPWGAMGIVRRLTAFRMHSRYTHRSEIRYFLEQTRDTTRQGYMGRLRILLEYDIRSHIQDLHVPTLILAADEDRLVPSVAQGEYMAARMPDATLRVLHGHGHVCLIAPNVDLEAIIREWGRVK